MIGREGGRACRGRGGSVGVRVDGAAQAAQDIRRPAPSTDERPLRFMVHSVQMTNSPSSRPSSPDCGLLLLYREAAAAANDFRRRRARARRHSTGVLSDSLELLTKAKLLLGALGGDDDTPTIIAGELLAARDDVSALLLSTVMLEEVGVAAPVRRDVVYRGAEQCYQRLQSTAQAWSHQGMTESVG
jgi:hypothetical protein